MAERRGLPRLFAISDRGARGALAPGDWLAGLAAAGLGGLQVREKEMEDGEVYALALLARRTLPPPACVVINGRADIALAAGLDGVHLPADGVPVAALRRRFGAALLIGRSTHAVAEVAAAAAEGADSVTFGPVYESPGKGPPAGTAALAEAAAQSVPVYALGGVSADRLAELAAAGAAGAAGIRLFADPALVPAVVGAAARAFARTPAR